MDRIGDQHFPISAFGEPIELIGMDEIQLLDMNPIQTFSSDYSSVHLEIKINTQNMLDSDTEITYRTKLHYDSPNPSTSN